MKVFIEPIARLINEFTKLPGVGTKTAQRFAYKIINMSDDDASAFAESIINAKKQVKYCTVCGNYSESEVCDICKERSCETVCVVKEPKDVIALEKAHEFAGVYHVLHGTLSPLDGIGPNQIRIKELLERVQKGGIKEVIMATNPDVEGEATAMYIATLLKPLGIKVTRLAHGIAVGTDIEYADVSSLSRAIIDRRDM